MNPELTSEAAAAMAPPRRKQPSLFEFTAMLAMLFATVSFSIDAMLPALPEIGAALSPDNLNKAQLVLTAFVFGMGAGTFFAGPLSDAFGRKPAIAGGVALYVLGALLAAMAPTLEMMLLARFIQGLGAAGPRIVGLAMVRDQYSGREMARVTSFVMMIFMLAPAVAPSIGQLIILVAGWRGVFLAFIVFGLTGLLWVSLRQPETLERPHRRPLHLATLVAAAREVLSNREVVIYTMVMTLGFAQMFAMISSAQQIFDITYDRGESFPRWFALMAVISAIGTMLNAKFVMKLGMRKIVSWAYLMQVVSAGLMLALTLGDALSPALKFPVFFIWAVSLMFMAGVTFGNLNALALQKMGHIAGMAASIVAAISTVFAVLIAAPIGLMFNGTPVPLVSGALICSALAWLLMRQTEEF